MTKAESPKEDQESSKRIKEFLEEYWPLALTVAGAVGAVGAAVWLTARYLRQKNHHDKDKNAALQLAEIEVETSQDPTAVILETGAYLGQVAGKEAGEAAAELSNHVNDPDTKIALQVLSTVAGEEQSHPKNPKIIPKKWHSTGKNT